MRDHTSPMDGSRRNRDEHVLVVALQGNKLGRKRIFGEALDNTARVRSAIHIVAERNRQGVLDRVCRQVAADLPRSCGRAGRGSRECRRSRRCVEAPGWSIAGPVAAAHGNADEPCRAILTARPRRVQPRQVRCRAASPVSRECRLSGARAALAAPLPAPYDRGAGDIAVRDEHAAREPCRETRHRARVILFRSGSHSASGGLPSTRNLLAKRARSGTWKTRASAFLCRGVARCSAMRAN